MKRLLLFFLLLVIITGRIQAQKIENINVQQVDNNIILAFNLLPQRSINEQYDLVITSSRDNYTEPLTVSKGNIKGVNPQNRLQYTIDGMEHFSGYTGQLDFQIEAKLTYAPLHFINPDNYSNKRISMKKGKSMQLSWRGGKGSEIYNLELYRNGEKISTIESNISKKVTTWDIPSKTKVSKNYVLKIAVEEDSEQFAFTKKIFIKRKFPIVITAILPLAIAGGVFATLNIINQKSDTGGSSVPAPPNPPN